MSRLLCREGNQKDRGHSHKHNKKPGHISITYLPLAWQSALAHDLHFRFSKTVVNIYDTLFTRRHIVKVILLGHSTPKLNYQRRTSYGMSYNGFPAFLNAFLLSTTS